MNPRAQKIYAGIGSRETPPDVLEVMRLLAGKMEEDGWALRSGGAAGADSAFESGVSDYANRAIYLPGARFNGRQAGSAGYHDSTRLPGWSQALETVKQFHPAPERLSPFARNLMARNAMQLLGPAMDRPADLVVAYTPGGQVRGGTGQALRMAGSLGIPVRNLGDSEALARARKYLGLDGGIAPEPVEVQPPVPLWSNKVGQGYEVSSQGDRRFSALYARLPDGRVIEDAWGQAKGYDDGRAAKGRPAVTPDFDYWGTYKGLWGQWADANPQLMAELANASQGQPLVDRFARTENNQARALAELLHEQDWSSLSQIAGGA